MGALSPGTLDEHVLAQDMEGGDPCYGGQLTCDVREPTAEEGTEGGGGHARRDASAVCGLWSLLHDEGKVLFSGEAPRDTDRLLGPKGPLRKGPGPCPRALLKIDYSL